MNAFHIAVAQLTALPGHISHNTATILMYMERAKHQQADLILFPECFLTGYYFPMNNALALDEQDIHIKRIQAKAKQLSIGILLTSFIKGEHKPYNSALLIDRDGSILLRYDKVHTCDFSNEVMLTSGTQFHVTTFDSIKLGVMICYDREYPESARELMLKGAEIILVPNDCSSMKPRVCALQTRAYENMTGIVMANPPGQNAGCSCAFSPIAWDENGTCLNMELMMADASSEKLYMVSFDMDAIRHYRSHEMMGNTFRKCHAYSQLLNSTIKDPFQR